MSNHHDLISVSQSYHDSVAFSIKHFGKLLTVTLIPSLITVFLWLSFSESTIAALYQLPGADFFIGNVNGTLLIALGIFLVLIVVDVIGLISLLSMITSDAKMGVLQVLEHSLTYFWRFIGLGLTLFVVGLIGTVFGIILVAIVGLVLGLFSLDLVDSTFYWLDTILPSLGATFATVFFLFTKFIIVDKNSGLRAALQQSMQLVRRHFWPVVFRVLLLYIVTVVFSLGFQLLPQIGNFLALAIVTPFFFVYLMILYRDLSSLNEQS